MRCDPEFMAAYELNLSGLGGQIDLCGNDAFNLAQGLLDARDTRSTGHAVDFERHGLLRNGVAGPLDGFGDRVRMLIGRGTQRDGLGREIDGGG